MQKAMDRNLNSRASKIGVLVADDTRFHTQLLAGVLSRNPDLNVVTSDLDLSSVMAASITQTIDVFLLSAAADGDERRGLEILRELKAKDPEILAIILLDSSKPQSVLAAFRAGARGVFDHRESVNMLLHCIRRVQEGQVWANSEQMCLLLDALALVPRVRQLGGNALKLLSKREADVVRCLAEGLSNREIAEHLLVSRHTIKNHMLHIFDKLGVSNRNELLFMTMTPSVAAPLLMRDRLKDPSGDYDPATLHLCEKAAEQGVLLAQLMLARLSWMSPPRDGNLIRAYRWFSIATEKLLGIKNAVKNAMTPTQLGEAERQIQEWVNRSHRGHPSGASTSPEQTRKVPA